MAPVLDDSEVQRVLVVTAHPDDVDFGAAGTVNRWTGAGTEVVYCICTDGDAGGFDPAVNRADIPEIRRKEQEAAAKVVGVHDVRFLGYPDGRLTASFELRRDISRVIRQVRPQRILIQSPERNWLRVGASHPDHLAAGTAAMAAVYPDARNPFAHPELLRDEGLAEWAAAETWVMAHPDNNHHIDITDVFDVKLAALRAHESQTAHMDDLEQRLREWYGANALAAGLPEGRLAERFFVVATA
ncbi:MAG: PIG-L family deacetylase [Sporichthyaceae bacterium]|nr:PIG-L family deacetylase [Sporichthyaceae bacterium]